jgi:hypothetical protein
MQAGQPSGEILRYGDLLIARHPFFSRLAPTPQHRIMHPAQQVVPASVSAPIPSNTDDKGNPPRRFRPIVSSCSIRRCILVPSLPLVPPPSHLPPPAQGILGPILRPVPSWWNTLPPFPTSIAPSRPASRQQAGRLIRGWQLGTLRHPTRGWEPQRRAPRAGSSLRKGRHERRWAAFFQLTPYFINFSLAGSTVPGDGGEGASCCSGSAWERRGGDTDVSLWSGFEGGVSDPAAVPEVWRRGVLREQLRFFIGRRGGRFCVVVAVGWQKAHARRERRLDARCFGGLVVV